MNDTISRQDVINLLRKWSDGYSWLEVETDFAIEEFKQLPPASSEIIRCKDCKHRPKFDEEGEELHFPTYKCPCQCEDYYYSWMPKDDWFCGNGERWEKND